MYSIYKAKKVKKLKNVETKRFRLFAIIRVKKKKMTVHTYIYILCNSRWEKFGDIRNNLFVQTGAELLDH